MRRGYYNKRATQVIHFKCDRYCNMSLDFSGKGNMKMMILWLLLRSVPNKHVPFIFLSSYSSLEDMISGPGSNTVLHF